MLRESTSQALFNVADRICAWIRCSIDTVLSAIGSRVDKVRLHFSLSFCHNLVFTRHEPATLALGYKGIGGRLRAVNLSTDTTLPFPYCSRLLWQPCRDFEMA